jgi:hypothetical protein
MTSERPTQFLDLPVECQQQVWRAYEADRRVPFDKVLAELLGRTREIPELRCNYDRWRAQTLFDVYHRIFNSPRTFRHSLWDADRKALYDLNAHRYYYVRYNRAVPLLNEQRCYCVQ